LETWATNRKAVTLHTNKNNSRKHYITFSSSFSSLERSDLYRFWFPHSDNLSSMPCRQRLSF